MRGLAGGVAAALAVASGALASAASAAVALPPMGGPGGGPFEAACPAGLFLWGLELRTGDDVDAARPVCARPVREDAVTGDVAIEPWHGGGGGGIRRLTCPLSRPVVLGLGVVAEGQETFIINSVRLYCGTLTDRPQAQGAQASAVFDGPPYRPSSGWGLTQFTQEPVASAQRCPDGLVASGIRGRSGVWLDALGLICDTPPFSAYVRLVRRSPSDPNAPRMRICARAADSRARNSPVAARLAELCVACLQAKGRC